MKCKEFKQALTTKTPTLYAYDANNNAEYLKWFNHSIECPTCRDLFMKASLLKRKIRTINGYPCIHIAYYVNHEDKTLKRIDKKMYGIPYVDGATYTIISHCPWCGKKIK